MIKTIRAVLCKISRRYKYHAICKATRMTKIGWQKEFVLKEMSIPLEQEITRGSGKTTAILMKLLMLDGLNEAEAKKVLLKDPDWTYDSKYRKIWYEYEHKMMVDQCMEYGIPVPVFRISRFEER